METIECKAVYLWDGGERQNFGFYVQNETDEAITKAHPHCRIETVVLTVFTSLAEVAENKHDKVLGRIWDKLTPLERKVLNLTPPRTR